MSIDDIKINQNIPGWMSVTDLTILGITAKIHLPGTTMVEIGSFCGRSSWALSQNLPSNSVLHCVDTWHFSKIYTPDSIRTDCYVSQEEKQTVFNIAKQNSDWLPAFEYCTQDCTNIKKFKMASESYVADQHNVSAVFIDGGHTFEDANRDISKFDFNDEVLLFGDDFVTPYTGVIKSVFKNQPVRNRLLVKLPKSKLWFLWPTKGFYSTQLGKFQEYVNQIYK